MPWQASWQHVLRRFPLIIPWMCKDKARTQFTSKSGSRNLAEAFFSFGVGGWVLDSSITSSWDHKRYSALRVPPVHLQKASSSAWTWKVFWGITYRVCELPVRRLRGKASALSVDRHLPTPEVSIMESCLPASTCAHGLFPLPLVFTCIVPR